MIVGFDAIRALRNDTGLGNYARGVLRALHRADPTLKCILYSSKPPAAEHATFPRQIKARLHGPPAKWRLPLGRAIWRTLQLGKTAAHDGVQLYHGLTHEIPRDLPATKIPSVVTFHDLIYHRHPKLFSAVDRRSYAWRYKWSAEHATAIVAVSESTRTDLLECYNIPPARVTVIPPVRDPHFAAHLSAVKRKSLCAGYDLPDEFLLIVGTLEARKNQRTAIAALAQLAPDTTPPLVLIGRDGGIGAELTDLAEKLGVADRVFFLPTVPSTDLPAIVQSATLFLYPSLAEGFGMPIVEALSAGVPVITSAGGCFPEAGGPESVYVPAEDATMLAAAIRRVLDDGALAQRMREAGREYAKRFDGDVLAPRLLAVYDAVVHGHALPTGAS